MQRLALCVYGSSYDYLSPLSGAKLDALAVAYALRRLDYRVTVLGDRDAVRLHVEVVRFLTHVREGDMVFVFMAGHGMQFRGKNYFLPRDYKEIAFPGLNFSILNAFSILDSIINPLCRCNVSLQVVVVDACREQLNGETGLATYPVLPECVMTYALHPFRVL